MKGGLFVTLALATGLAGCQNPGKESSSTAEPPRKAGAPASEASRVAWLSPGATELRSQFNEDREKTRLLALLSPT
jgi:hypothetical protein